MTSAGPKPTLRRRLARGSHALRLTLGVLGDRIEPAARTVRRVLRHGRLVFVAFLVAALLLVPLRAERWGDSLQIALPLAGLACAIGGGGVPEMVVRFVILEVGIHGPKNTLGDRPINLRPNGTDRGFPSGHTAAAAFGASTAIRHCVQRAPVLRAVAIVAAGFVGTSRVEAEKHDIWQVLAGAIWGLVAANAFRTGHRRALRAGAERWSRRLRRAMQR